MADYSWLKEALQIVQIRQKTGGIVPMACYPWQNEFIDKLSLSTRHIVNKSRQIGSSTINCAILYLLCVMNPGVNAKIIANKKEIAQHLLDTVRIIHEGIPKEHRPACAYESRWELFFQHNKSRLSISASTKDVGRGETINYLLCTEVAFWENAEEAMLGLMECVPQHGSLIIVESTPNGVGNWNHTTAVKAQNKEIDWIYHEYPYNVLPEYDEVWKANKLKEKGVTAFMQEYGCSFILSMRTVFSEFDWIEKKPYRSVELVPTTKLDMVVCPVTGEEITMEQAKSAGVPIEKVHVGFKLIDIEVSDIRMWKEVEANHEYVIGADVAEGLSIGDYSVAYVIDTKTFEVVCCWHGHTAPDLFGWELMKLGRYYNNALIGVEVNNHGLSTINTLKEKYENVYCREVLDELTSMTLKKLGWQTTMRTKPLMVDDLSRVIREKELKVWDDQFKKELSTFCYNDSGKMGAVSGCYDDRVIAMAIAVQMYLANPYTEWKPLKTAYMPGKRKR